MSGLYRIFVFNVTHNCVDSQIHSSGPFCRSEMITVIFRWHIYGSLQHEDGLWQSQIMKVRGIALTPDPTWGAPLLTLIYQIITHLSKYEFVCAGLTLSRIITWHQRPWRSHQLALTLFCSQIWQILLLVVEVTHAGVTLKVHHVTCHWMNISSQQLAASCWDRVPFETKEP